MNAATSNSRRQEGSDRLKITEIFLSLQGESNTVGLPTVFVRLTGCPLRCQYCDTAYAFHGGEWMALDAIADQVSAYQVPYVTVTGGEPLAQKPSILLLKQLCDLGYRVSLETSGALDIAKIDQRVIKVMDLKTPGSGERARNRYENIDHLRRGDQVKFVLCNKDDYEWAKQQIIQYDLTDRCDVLFSPSHDQLDARVLADWVVEDHLPVRFQIQLHKYLWGNVPGR